MYVSNGMCESLTFVCLFYTIFYHVNAGAGACAGATLCVKIAAAAVATATNTQPCQTIRFHSLPTRFNSNIVQSTPIVV